MLEEVARLSETYRAAVVLCELEGRTRAAAARELGIAEGTLSSRLAAARRTLARRLGDRGLAPAVFAAVAGSAACPVLAADAIRLGGASAVPRVEQLSVAVMKAVFPIRWAVASAAAVVISLGFALGGADPVPVVSKPVVRLQPAPKPAAKGPNKILFYRNGYLALIDPDGKNDKKLGAKHDDYHPHDAKLSPDGRTVAVSIPVPPTPGDRPADGEPPRKLIVREASLASNSSLSP